MPKGIGYKKPTKKGIARVPKKGIARKPKKGIARVPKKGMAKKKLGIAKRALDAALKAMK